MSIQGPVTRFPTRLARRLFTPTAAWGCLAIIGCCALWIAVAFARGYSFDTRILALLPNTYQGAPAGAKDAALGARVDEHLAELAGQRMVFLISHVDHQQSVAAAVRFAEVLDRSGLFTQVQGRLGRQQTADWQATFFPYRYALVPRAARRQLELLPVNEQHPVLQQALARLYSPMASAVAPNLVDDPLQLFFAWHLDVAPKTPFTTENGWLTRKHDGRVYRLLSVSLSDDPYAFGYQEQVSATLAEAEASLPAGAQLLSSGLLIHAAHGAAQARKEISTIGLGSLLGISFLLIYCFRRPRFLLLAFLPIATGWLFALAICMAVFDQLHLLTLVFGASLIGVAIDYSLHYLCAYGSNTAEPRAPVKSGKAALLTIMPGISLGLLSSALAYAAQGAAPFPGLRQMAMFSVCGLIGAWVAVVVWLPHLSSYRFSSIDPPPLEGQQRAPLHRLAGLLARLLARWPNIASPWLATVLTVTVALSVYQLTRLEFGDDVQHLQTSPQSLIAEDAQVQRLTGAINPSRYFLVSAATEQAVLEAEEKLHGPLGEWKADGRLYDFQAISKWVPPSATQEKNRLLNRDVIHADNGLATLLAKAIGSPQLAIQMRTRFDQATDGTLGVEEWLASQAGKNQDFLWLGEFDGRFHSLVLVAGVRDSQTLQQLERFASMDPRIQFVDKIAAISGVLEEHRRQLQLWIALAYGVLLALLTWRYGRAAWRILSAPAIASALALAILSWSGLTINIFNLLALLLVLGIGLDAGIFLWESRLRESAGRSDNIPDEVSHVHYTWLAVTMAALTTLLAFGLLSFSETPVLHQFGVTVLMGIVGVWCLTPCFSKIPLPEHKDAALSIS